MAAESSKEFTAIDVEKDEELVVSNDSDSHSEKSIPAHFKEMEMSKKEENGPLCSSQQLPLTVDGGVHSAQQEPNRTELTPEELAELLDFDLTAFFNTMRDESERLKTFLYGEWPIRFMDPKQLARAGFFYLQNGDRVQCAFCRGVVSKWEEGDIPMYEHRKHFSSCPFVRGSDVGNKPIGRDPVRSTAPLSVHRQCTRDVCLWHDKPRRGHIKPCWLDESPSEQKTTTTTTTSHLSLLKEYDVHLIEKPKYEQFKTLYKRLHSFEKAGQNKLGNYSSKELADCGFFLRRPAYLVCAFCGLSTNVEDFSRNVWEEHALRQPSCFLLKMRKGSSFLEACSQLRQSSGQEEKSFPPLKTTTTEDVEKVDDSTGIDKQQQQQLVTGEEGEKKRGQAGQDQKGGDLDKEDRSEQRQQEECLEEERGGFGSLPTVSCLDQETRAIACKVCLDAPIGLTFLPCGHLVACITCGMSLSACPICRRQIKGFVKSIIS